MNGRPPGATIDLRAAQSPGYQGRGVARYAIELTTALAVGYPEVVQRVVVDPDLPPPAGIDALVATGLVTTVADWPEYGGCYHQLAPFDLDAPLAALWPPVATVRRMRLVVTVLDLIPEVMADVYLTDPGRRRRYRARRELVRAADHIVADSASAAADVTSYLGIDARRVTVTGAACGAAFHPPASRPQAAARARAAIAGLGDAWLLYNGAIEPRKNTEALVEAYAALPDDVRQRWQLVVVCDLNWAQRHHFEVRAEQLGIVGRLVLPGRVPDDVLVALNQAADLMVFPSLYEGFGLPVAEALACGTAVIASEVSAPAELVAPGATFDPHDRQAITTAMARALTDPAVRAGLLAWSVRPQAGWDDVARRTAEVYRRVLDRPAPPARPTLALVTPWPPQKTGVADYSARLLTALHGKATVDLFIDGDEPGADGLAATQPPFPPRQLPRSARLRGGYDAVVIALGNSEFHAGGLGLVRFAELEPVVVAHDVRLTGLYRHSQARGAVPEGFAAALGAMYPGLDVIEDGWVPPEVARGNGILMAREVIGRSGVFAPTSDYASALARLDAAPEAAGKVATLPYAYPAVVPRRPEGEEPGLVCSFGIVNDSKQPRLLIDAVALLGAPARLALVGPASGGEQEALAAHAAARGVDLTVAGYTSAVEYEDWLRRASVAVQLRRWPGGETSGAVADCLTHGLVTIVSEVGTAHDLPPSVIKVGADADARRLSRIIAGLLGDAPRRRERGLAAQRWAEARGFEEAAADLLHLVATRGQLTTGSPR